MHDPAAMLAQESHIERPGTNLNLYQKKRELEKNIEDAEKKLSTKQKELKSLKQMVATYKSNPKFGNPKHFQGDIQNLTKEIADLDNAVRAMKADHAAIEDRLESLRSRSPMVNVTTAGGGASPMMLTRDRTPRSSQSSGSLKSSNLSIGSNQASSSHHMNTSPDSLYEQVPYNEWDDDFDTPPPPPPLTQNGNVTHCVALYGYPPEGQDLQETNIPMREGEEFELVEEDSDGWTMVRRLTGYREQGYVPTSYLKVIK